jgi:hypothetical protein
MIILSLFSSECVDILRGVSGVSRRTISSQMGAVRNILTYGMETSHRTWSHLLHRITGDQSRETHTIARHGE